MGEGDFFGGGVECRLVALKRVFWAKANGGYNWGLY